MYISIAVEINHHLISIWLYFILTILIMEDGSQPSFFSNCNSAGFFHSPKIVLPHSKTIAPFRLFLIALPLRDRRTKIVRFSLSIVFIK
jgi:hypothetical protein